MRQQLWEWRHNIALMEGTSCLSSRRAGRHQWPHRENWRRCFHSTTTSEIGGRRPSNQLWWEWMCLQLCRKCVQLLPHLVSLVVEPDPGDSGVAWTSEAQDLLGVTPLKHPHATILSSRQVWKTTPPHHFLWSAPYARISDCCREISNPPASFSPTCGELVSSNNSRLNPCNWKYQQCKY